MPDRLERLIAIAVPMAIASITTRVAAAAASLPIDDTKLQMLRERNVLSEGVPSTLAELGVTPTPDSS